MNKEKIGLLALYMSVVLPFITFPLIGFWSASFLVTGFGTYFALSHRRRFSRPHPKHYVIMGFGAFILVFGLAWIERTAHGYVTFLLRGGFPMLFILTYIAIIQLKQIDRIEQDGDANGITPRC